MPSSSEQNAKSTMTYMFACVLITLVYYRSPQRVVFEYIGKMFALRWLSAFFVGFQYLGLCPRPWDCATAADFPELCVCIRYSVSEFLQTSPCIHKL